MARERSRWPLVVDRAREIVDGYAPLKVTLRQVMYRVAAEGVLPHTPPMYRRLSARLAQARREGRFPDLIDTVREVHVPPSWPSADAFVREMPDWFRLDRTAGQEHALYVAAEKDTLRQQLTGWLEFAGIPVLIVRGFSSQSHATSSAPASPTSNAKPTLPWSATSTARARTSSGTGWSYKTAGRWLHMGLRS
ncbi:hypothetical protein ACFY7H_29530 [Streptomyces sp. NPDC012794]|uniref:hypothetical protein n=1 Tax=Streptomyces sp. NPDC012794 TaxID=3364850 RepID=UPI00369BDEFF